MKVCICWQFLLPPLKSCLPGGRIGVSEGTPIALCGLSDEDEEFVTDILQRCIPPSLLGRKPHSIGIPSSPSCTAMHPITVLVHHDITAVTVLIITIPSQLLFTVPTWTKRCGRHYIPVCLLAHVACALTLPHPQTTSQRLGFRYTMDWLARWCCLRSKAAHKRRYAKPTTR